MLRDSNDFFCIELFNEIFVEYYIYVIRISRTFKNIFILIQFCTRTHTHSTTRFIVLQSKYGIPDGIESQISRPFPLVTNASEPFIFLCKNENLYYPEPWYPN